MINKQKILCFTISFICFFYPISASLITIFNLPSTPINIFFRSIGTLTCLIFIIFKLNKSNLFSNNQGTWFLVSFWLFYSFRILFDLSNGVRFGEYNNSQVYGFAFGNILVPIISIVLWKIKIDIRVLNTYIYYFVFTSAILILCVILSQNGGLNSAIFLQRASLQTKENIENGSTVLNSITVGYFGELLAVISFFKLAIFQRNFIYYLVLLVFGFLLIFLGASRGPLIGSLITILLILIYKAFHSKKKVRFFLKAFVMICFGGILFTYIFSNFIEIDNLYLIERVFSFYEDRINDNEEARDVLIKSAFNDFLDSPVFGKQFVGTYDNFYPHNLLVEVLMATGVIGGFLFLGFYTNVILRLIQIFKNKNTDLFLFLVVYLPVIFSSLTSGALFLSIEFWLLSTILVCLGKNQFV
jgi:O-Antigen ligase